MAQKQTFMTYQERDREVEGTALLFLHRVVQDGLVPYADRMTAAIEILRYLGKQTYGANVEGARAGAKAGEHLQKGGAGPRYPEVLLHEDVEKAPASGY